MSTAPTSPAIAGIAHHTAAVNGAELHYVSAGTTGSPILLVHGFPESWWAFHRLIPLLAERHRVFAVDLRGFGDSQVSEGDHDSAVSAEDLRQLIAHLGVGPVHLTGQDISGGTVFRLAATQPEDIRSFTAIEMLDAAWDAAKADARLRACGIRRGVRGPRRRPKAGWAALTETEQRVAALLAEGLSNPQIAGRMFTSRRTVQFHVSSILAKLGLSSRVELATLIARRAG